MKEDNGMEPGQRKQHVPVFVGSTFEDLKDCRRATRDALSQLEAIVRGMEYFGSKPGSPVDECLAAARSCTIYIGIFGMRYGTVPDNYDRSMTHLEYDEAQRSELPSLIYILDEEVQPLLPKFVETGEGAVALRTLKGLLRKRHVVSMFTTPEDLARRVLHDVPAVLRTIGAKVEGELPAADTDTSVLKKFALLPKMFKGRDVIFEFTIDSFGSVDAEDCEALGLDPGATIRDHVTLLSGGYLYVYASSKVAEGLLDVPKGTKVRAKGVTIYGTTEEVQWHDSGSFAQTHEHRGVSLKEILAVTPPAGKQDAKDR